MHLALLRYARHVPVYLLKFFFFTDYLCPLKRRKRERELISISFHLSKVMFKKWNPPKLIVRLRFLVSTFYFVSLEGLVQTGGQVPSSSCKLPFSTLLVPLCVPFVATSPAPN